MRRVVDSQEVLVSAGRFGDAQIRVQELVQGVRKE